MAIRTFLKSSKSALILLGGVLIGGLLGSFVPESAAWLAPIGNIFMNLLLVMIVPMVFFSVSSSVCHLSSTSSLGRTMFHTSWIILVVLVLLGVLTYFSMLLVPPIASDINLGEVAELAEQRPVGELLVDAVTVTDFAMLFSVRHILPLMIVALLFGVAVTKLHQERIVRALDTCNAVVVKMMDCLMVLAPLGLGCYFADVMSKNDLTLVAGYGRVLGMFIALAAIVYFIVNPLMGRIAGIRFRDYWRQTLPPSLLAISTLSSSVCIPANIKASKGMGCDSNLSESIVPLGTQLFKQGSMISGAMKVAFIMLLCGKDLCSVEAIVYIFAIALFASMVVGAVPTGAGTAELFICSVLGAPASMVGLLMVISTLVDMPATLINVSGNAVLPSVVERVTRRHKTSSQ